MNTPAPSQYVAIKVFGVISAVLMTLVALSAVVTGLLWMSIGHNPEAWDIPNLSAQSAFYFRLMGIVAIAFGANSIFAAFCGIGITLRWRWTRPAGIVAHAIILVVAQSGLVYELVRRAGTLHGRDERIAFVTIISLSVFLVLYAIWALVTLLGPWAGKYFARNPF
jgi:hypothetical protein